MSADNQIESNSKLTPAGRKENRSHPKLVVFLVCLVISILMWLFIELMKDYTDEIRYDITFSNAPKDLILTNSGDNILSIGINAQGFELLAAKYAQKRRTLNVDLSTLKIRSSGDEYTAYLPSARIIEQLGTQIRFDKEITFIKPDTLFFRFSEIYRKQVPVRPDIVYTLNGQFDITDSISINPKYVSVSSVKSIIDTLTFIKTQKLRFNQLDSSINVNVALFKGAQSRLIRYSSDSVNLTFHVEKVTEAGYKVPVSVKGNGENVKIYPDKVDIICRVPLSEYPHIEKSDFAAEVEYLTSGKNEKKLRVTLVRVPKSVRVLKINPEEVEYIIISK